MIEEPIIIEDQRNVKVVRSFLKCNIKPRVPTKAVIIGCKTKDDALKDEKQLPADDFDDLIGLNYFNNLEYEEYE